ncbi:hypothetical protein XH99_00240 [Bradyrhizobium nanningense]|uniref:Uncharacterized protein n=1 Tax=Bradyrhizobium nanningense TaxID=1325118 RepID=A0A4Q0SLQ1_9BRAD|nr:hypothetical protein XH99_00240 [Bradyrhizobium nanningense]
MPQHATSGILFCFGHDVVEISHCTICNLQSNGSQSDIERLLHSGFSRSAARSGRAAVYGNVRIWRSVMMIALVRFVRSVFAAAFAASRMEVGINVPSARARNAHGVLLCQFDRAKEAVSAAPMCKR